VPGGRSSQEEEGDRAGFLGLGGEKEKRKMSHYLHTFKGGEGEGTSSGGGGGKVAIIVTFLSKEEKKGVILICVHNQRGRRESRI